MTTDGELLRRYLNNGDESAFTELVRRHLNLVYRVALRRVGGDAHAAEDVTQKIFTALAHKASTLHDRPDLAGWLYTSTRFAAADAVRAERRRRAYEQKSGALQPLDSPSHDDTGRFEPFLDEVLDLLDDQERHAVLLHFFEGRTFAEVGASLSLSADAVRMRINRALVRLRPAFAERGVLSTTAALATLLSAQSAPAAPETLAATVVGRALGAGPAAVPRFVQTVKNIPLASGVAAIAVLLTFIAVALRPRLPVDDFSTTNSGRSAGAKAAQESITEDAITAPRHSAAAAGSAAEPPFNRDRLANFSDHEKTILNLLWNRQQHAALLTGARATLRVGQDAPNFDGVDPLLKKHLIDQREALGPVTLTTEGLKFCESHREDIEAHPITANLRAAPDFMSLSALEKDLLKILWIQHAATPVPPGVRIGLKLGLASLLTEACDPLLEQGLIAIGPKTGMIYLTNSGRAFCSAHQPALKAHSANPGNEVILPR